MSVHLSFRFLGSHPLPVIGDTLTGMDTNTSI